MFTVKHIECDGFEILIQADEVWCTPHQDGEKNPSPREVCCGLRDEQKRFSTGDVYVMNEAGKTVSVFHLGYSHQEG